MPDQPPDLPGVTHRFVDADGLRVHVADAGPEDDPTPVVLVHGWPQHWWMWRAVLPALAAAGKRALAVDLRGHGWTDAPPRGYDKPQLATDVLHAIDALGVDRFGIAGHDWGGYVTQLLALRVPERVERVAILNMVPVWRDPRPRPWDLWRLWYQVPLITPRVHRVAQPYATARLPGVPGPDAQVYAARWHDPARADAGQQVYRRFLAEDVPNTVRGRLEGQRITAPLLVVHGTKDFVIVPRMVERFRDHGDDVTIEYVEDAGHFIADERPELVAQRLERWFSSGR